MPLRIAEAEWLGSLREGKGTMKLGSGAYQGAYSFWSRFENAKGSNPEELIGASLAGCFSMALSASLTKSGYHPARIHTVSRVHLEKIGEGYRITTIDLDMDSDIPDIDERTFHNQAENAKKNCPVSKALSSVDIKLNAKLLKTASAR